MIKNFYHMIPKLSLPSKIAVSKFLSKISFVGYSGKSKVLKLSILKSLTMYEPQGGFSRQKLFQLWFKSLDWK